jgi:hypothetical protein
MSAEDDEMDHRDEEEDPEWRCPAGDIPDTSCEDRDTESLEDERTILSSGGSHEIRDEYQIDYRDTDEPERERRCYLRCMSSREDSEMRLIE